MPMPRCPWHAHHGMRCTNPKIRSTQHSERRHLLGAEVEIGLDDALLFVSTAFCLANTDRFHAFCSSFENSAFEFCCLRLSTYHHPKPPAKAMTHDTVRACWHKTWEL